MRYSPFGGAETFLGRFMDELVRRGHAVEVFSTGWEEKQGIKLNRVKAWGPSFLRPLTFALSAKKAVEAARLDVVVSLERTFCQDIYRAGDGCHREWLIRRKAASGFFKRIAISLNPLHPVLLYIEKRLFTDKRLKKVVANSNGVKSDIIRHYGLPEEKIYVIYNGIDLNVFKGLSGDERGRIRGELGVPESAILLLFVGSGFERKGLMYVIRALGLLKDKGDIRLLVIGKGRHGEYLKEARRLGVAERVIFKGPVKGAVRYYSAGDIFTLPSIYEPFSNACLEAMAAGLPVITSKVNGASEVITDGVNGGVVDDSTDEKEIAGKIIPFLDKDTRLRAGGLARDEAFKYPIERNVSEFLKLLES